MPTVVATGMPVIGFAPLTALVSLAAGLLQINTVGLPTMIAPVQAAPETESPIKDAGWPPIRTVGAPGPVIASPVTVTSPTRAAGNGISSPFSSFNYNYIKTSGKLLVSGSGDLIQKKAKTLSSLF